MESISIYPGNIEPPSWYEVEAILKRTLPDKMLIKIGEEISPVMCGMNLQRVDLKQPFPVRVDFGINCTLKPQFTVSLMRQEPDGRGYLIDALSDCIQEDGEQEVLHLKDAKIFWDVIHHHEYQIYISSPARRVKGEKKLMLFLAAAFAGATNGYVYATEPGFFGVPYGIYDFDSICKVISQNT